MTQWWEIGVPAETVNGPPKIRAVAYYRHSAQDRQENSIPIQQDQVREWALMSRLFMNRNVMAAAAPTRLLPSRNG